MVTSTSWEFNSEVPIPRTLLETRMYPIQGAPTTHLITWLLHWICLTVIWKCSLNTVPNEMFNFNNPSLQDTEHTYKHQYHVTWGGGCLELLQLQKTILHLSVWGKFSAGSNLKGIVRCLCFLVRWFKKQEVLNSQEILNIGLLGACQVFWGNIHFIKQTHSKGSHKSSGYLWILAR